MITLRGGCVRKGEATTHSTECNRRQQPLLPVARYPTTISGSLPSQFPNAEPCIGKVSLIVLRSGRRPATRIRRNLHTRAPALQGPKGMLPLSDARVPGVASIRVSAPQTLAERFEVVCQSQAIDIFHVLVTELPRDSQAQGAPERYGKFVSVHAVGKERLRVQGVRHVDALPPVRLDRAVYNVTRLRQRANTVQDVRERHPSPFGDVSPSFFTADHGDLRTGGEALDLRQRERARSRRHPVDSHPPVRETGGLESLEFVAQWIDFIGERILRNLSTEKLTGQGMASQKSLRRVGQRFSRAVESTGVRRDEPMMLRDFGSDGKPRCTGRHSQPRGDEFASRDSAHNFTPSVG